MRWTTWRLFSELSRDNMGTFLLFQNVRNRFVHSCHPFLWNSGSELELRYHFDSDLSFDFYINKATRLALHYLNYKRIYIYIRLENSTHPFFPAYPGPDPPLPSQLLRLIQDNTTVFPGWLGDVICPECPGSAQSFHWDMLGTLRRCRGGISVRCPNHLSRVVWELEKFGLQKLCWQMAQGLHWF